MNRNFWVEKYPEGVQAEINSHSYTSILDVLDQACRKFQHKPAFTNLGKTITYGELDELSTRFAGWLQHATDLVPGDRIAVQLPNLNQFPVVIFGALKAGLIVVNTNPLYTECEMEHQFRDSRAKALVVLANMAHMAEVVLPRTSIKHVIVTEVGDMLNPVKRFVVNGVLKHVQKMVPAYSLPKAVSFNEVLAKGAGFSLNRHQAAADDTAVLQYTGGTTGVAKGAELTHANIVSNMEQVYAFVERDIVTGGELIVAPLPLYHIFSFTVHCMVGLKTGMHNLLITNPRDLKSFVKELKKYPYTMLVGLNTLFNGLMNNPDFQGLDFSRLKMTLSGGMALQMETAKRWQVMTGCEIIEGYGMTEASPVVTLNPLSGNHLGTIGMPLPSTELKVVNEEGEELPVGEAGELCIRGPQVMKGYWQRPDETASALTGDGWLGSGDIAVIDDEGYVRIVDRKKDMISVSGFNVYPNELEDVLVRHPDVEQCAAIGVPCPKTGERIKMFVVSKNPALTPEDIRSHFRQYVTGYKVPKLIDFRDQLPTTNVGKILRRALRDEELARMAEEETVA